eukprot:641394-Amphidinium_carterae.1
MERTVTVSTTPKLKCVGQTTNSGHDPQANGLAERWLKIGPCLSGKTEVPRFGESAVVTKPEEKAGPFTGKGFMGVFHVCWSHSISHGEIVMVQRDVELDAITTAKSTCPKEVFAKQKFLE